MADTGQMWRVLYFFKALEDSTMATGPNHIKNRIIRRAA
jgi:hypothetical protein